MKRPLHPIVEDAKRTCLKNISIPNKRSHVDVNESNNKRIKMETYEDGLRDGKKAWEDCFNIQTFYYNMKLFDEVSKAFENVSNFYEAEIEKMRRKSKDINWVL
tara:strand:- start:960 stop:1271 length:312 start_codon:yes stop_codon:yes gene_type:complete